MNAGHELNLPHIKVANLHEHTRVISLQQLWLNQLAQATPKPGMILKVSAVSSPGSITTNLIYSAELPHNTLSLACILYLIVI